jgi:uncharacterized protein YhjY with autotransporter beta-barrel domain
MKMLNDRTEKRLMEKSPKAVSLTVGKYAIPRWSIDDAERVTDPLWQMMQADHWAEKQTWLDEQSVPYEILTHSHHDVQLNAAVIHVVLLTTSENAVMFRLTFGT